MEFRRQLCGRAAAVEVDVEDAGSLPQQVMVDRGYVDAAIEQRRNDQRHFPLAEDQVPHHVAGVGTAGEAHPGREGERRLDRHGTDADVEVRAGERRPVCLPRGGDRLAERASDGVPGAAGLLGSQPGSSEQQDESKDEAQEDGSFRHCTVMVPVIPDAKWTSHW